MKASAIAMVLVSSGAALLLSACLEAQHYPLTERAQLELVDMAISITTNRSGPYTGDGVTVNFAYGFKIIEDSDLRVFQRTISSGAVSELTLNTDYTVTGAGEAGGGNVVMTAAPSSSYEIVILRALTQDQDTDLSNQGGWFPQVHEDVFDYLTMLVQDLQEQSDRAIKIGETEEAFSDNLAGDRAGYVMGFDMSGNPTLLSSASGVILDGTVGSRTGTEGTNSFVNGTNVEASGSNSRAQGANTAATGENADASGSSTIASAPAAHAEGFQSDATETAAHAEGCYTAASGYLGSHAEGYFTVASGAYGSHAEGSYCRATGNYGSHAQGNRAVASLLSEDAHAGGRFAADGDAQVRRFVMRGATTNAEPLQLVLPEHFVIDDEHSVVIFVKIHGRQDTGAEHYSNFITATLDRTGGAVTLIGAQEELMTPIDTGGWGGVAITADNTNKCPKIEVTGKLATNIRWVALVEAVQIGYSD